MVSNKGISKLPGAPYSQVRAVSFSGGYPPLTSPAGLFVLHVVCLFDGDLSRGRAETHHARSRVSWRPSPRFFFGSRTLSEETLTENRWICFLGDRFTLQLNGDTCLTHVKRDSARKISSTQKKVPAVMGYDVSSLEGYLVL